MRSKDRSAGNTRKGFRRSLLPVSLLIVVLLAGLTWSWVDAQARTVVVVSSVLKTRALTPVVELATGEPRFADTSVAGNPVFIVRPRGEGPWPALFFVNGVVTEGRKVPEVRRLAEGLARAISERPDARDGEVSLAGVSTGATLALLAAEEDDLEGRISVVAGVAPTPT